MKPKIEQAAEDYAWHTTPGNGAEGNDPASYDELPYGYREEKYGCSPYGPNGLTYPECCAILRKHRDDTGEDMRKAGG